MERKKYIFILGAIAITAAFFTGMLLPFGSAWGLEFGGDVLPGSTSTFKLGDVSRNWKSINELIYFEKDKVGIGPNIAGLTQTLEIQETVQLKVGDLPACNADSRGGLWVKDGGPAATDTVQVCIRNASGTFVWKEFTP